MARILVVLLAAVAAALASGVASRPAQAQAMFAEMRAMPTLKRAVTVSDPLVRIGDLVEPAGALAGVPIFRAPDVGTSGTVSTAQILEALRAYRLVTLDVGDITEVEVTRAGHIVSAAAIRSRIVRAFAGQYGLGDADSLSLTLERDIRSFAVEPTVTGDLTVSRASYDSRTGRFDITLEVPGSAIARRVPLRWTGTLHEMIDAVVLTHTVQRGDILKATDVAVERRPKTEVPIDATATTDKIAGLSVRQPLRAGQALRRGDLTKPEVVKRDDTVTLIYQAPGLLLTTRGKALENGAEGDLVSAVNLQSKRTVQGIVTGSGQITLVATTSRVLTTASIDPAAAERVPSAPSVPSVSATPSSRE